MSSHGTPPDPSTALLRKWQDDGDLEALNALLQTEIKILKQMIRSRGIRRLSASAATSDIAQEAVTRFLRVRRKPRFDAPSGLRGYLWRAAWHLLLQRLDRRPVFSIDGEGPEAPGFQRFLSATASLANVDGAERATAVALAMNLLSTVDREIVRRVYFDDVAIATAAVAVGLSRDAANMRLVRARRKLAALLADWSDLIS